jgi:hypothetical protein
MTIKVAAIYVDMSPIPNAGRINPGSQGNSLQGAVNNPLPRGGTPRWGSPRRPMAALKSTARISYKIVQWRATVDEDGHYSFAVPL